METKICTKCKIDKELSEFNENNTTKDKLSAYCNSCVKKCSKESYLKNKDKINKRHIEQNKLTTLFIFNLKKGKKCEKCGYNKYLESLDFHHIDPKQKEFGISSGKVRGLTDKSKNKIYKEIAKSIVLCSNCHRGFHYLERKNGITIEKYLKENNL